MIRVGFTGTQHGMTHEQKVTVIKLLRELNSLPVVGTFRHGDCIGADKDAHALARSAGYRIIVHPPDSDRKRAWCQGDEIWPMKPYLIRNHDIVDNSDRVVACPKLVYEELRSGTWATIRYARKLGRPLYVVWPDGTLLMEDGGRR